ncbi:MULTISPECIES: DUF7310 family coiled-coil domain-containing protein [Halorubrum]|uniref:DUF7310 domain-containing protein n=1 Tax=Halorubrum sodomense TaxID=35743 RepID=A0A1I6FU65_HALSD|nr:MULTISPECIES: hypothetical protein [Halorubrum]TKX69534.1 hypothetical protein EXE45_07840 [Halorubrum sp. SP9]SFR33470.1 hypothetical protein SAMN04487937_1207 [Halorubrum sodomense]
MSDNGQSAGPGAETDAAPPRPGTEATTGANGSTDRIESRLRAVERAVTGSDARPADAVADAEATAERDRLESRLDDLEERVAELEAATQAIRGYAGSVRAVNREVERRADLALARATEAGREVDGARERSGERGDAAADRSDRRSRRRDATPTDDTGDAVPSESALDAALPDDRSASGPRDGGGDGSLGRDADGDGSGDGDAWAADALDRLRESL